MPTEHERAYSSETLSAVRWMDIGYMLVVAFMVGALSGIAFATFIA